MKARYSIVDGEVVMAAAPTPAPQMVVQGMFVRLDSFVREHRLGTVFLVPLDVIIRRDPLRTRQPAVMFISNALRYIIGRQVIEGGPDLAIEILSPTNTRRGLEEKLRDYQSINVREAWIVATQGQTVEVLQLSPERLDRSGLYGLGDLIISQVLPELRLMVDEIFPEL
jgi:Uma2 family endonuclease